TAPAPASASVSSINAVRESADLRAVAEHGGLAAVATRHSRDMAARGAIFHTASIEAAVGSVLPDWTRAGENVGVGGSVSAVNAEFLRSSTHRANIVGDYTLAGVGVFTSGDGQVWVTQVFAKTSVASAPAPTPAGEAGAAPSAPAGTARPPATPPSDEPPS
ncbi:MAG: hypothetical protein CYG61_01945, partial [Actinobacteria bacterium]